MHEGLKRDLFASFRARFSGRFVQENSELPSWFDVSGAAALSMGAAAEMLSDFIFHQTGKPSHYILDQRLASLWFGMTLKPIGWSLPPVWDAVAGDYKTKDGWIRLHTNAPHHRNAALCVLKVPAEREAVAKIVSQWSADDLEQAVVDAKGCAAAMRSLQEWQDHPVGRAVAGEPLVHWDKHSETDAISIDFDKDRPLGAIKVLDLTRVLAGPVAGRFLAALGADVLRIDPPDWNEPTVEAEVTLGKRCAGLDLTIEADRARFTELITRADLLLHGYRADALSNLGFGSEQLRALNPKLVDVCLNAYGWTGPWRNRRGFDSLVQMSSGIAHQGMKHSGNDKPTPLPVQALDHATGYLMAAAALKLLSARMHGEISSARLSLARTAHWLIQTRREDQGQGIETLHDADYDEDVEETSWGAAHRVRFPVRFGDFNVHWPNGARALRSDPANWLM